MTRLVFSPSLPKIDSILGQRKGGDEMSYQGLLAVMALAAGQASPTQTLLVYDQICLEMADRQCGSYVENLNQIPEGLERSLQAEQNRRYARCRSANRDANGACVRDVGAILGAAVSRSNDALLRSYLGRLQALLDRLEETGVTQRTGRRGSR